MEVKLVGIVLKDESPDALDASDALARYLDQRGIGHFVIISGNEAAQKGLSEKVRECSLCVTLGGDGTILFAARVFSPYEIPIVGINLGGLGFLTEFRKSELFDCVESILKGTFRLEERIMVDVKVLRNGQLIHRSMGLNDLVVTSGTVSRLIELEVFCGHTFIGAYRADGIIVSTPTGSTAYSLAAGGPILEPSMHAFVISPICPHFLGARPLVVPAEESVRISMLTEDREVTGTVDGQVAFSLDFKDEILVQKASVRTKLISLRERSFYDIVREKLSWKG